MMRDPEILRERGRNLEDEFFHRADKQLLARLKEAKAIEATRETLGRASGVTDPAVLENATSAASVISSIRRPISGPAAPT